MIAGVFAFLVLLRSPGLAPMSARRKTSGNTELLSNFVETYAGRPSYRFGSVYLFFIAPRYSCDHINPLEKQGQKCALGPWDLRVETRQGLEPPIKTFWTLACFGNLAFVLDVVIGSVLSVWTIRPDTKCLARFSVVVGVPPRVVGDRLVKLPHPSRLVCQVARQFI